MFSVLLGLCPRSPYDSNVVRFVTANEVRIINQCVTVLCNGFSCYGWVCTGYGSRVWIYRYGGMDFNKKAQLPSFGGMDLGYGFSRSLYGFQKNISEIYVNQLRADSFAHSRITSKTNPANISMGPYGVPGSLSMGPYGVPGSWDSWTRGLGTQGLGTLFMGPYGGPHAASR